MGPHLTPAHPSILAGIVSALDGIGPAFITTATVLAVQFSSTHTHTHTHTHRDRDTHNKVNDGCAAASMRVRGGVRGWLADLLPA